MLAAISAVLVAILAICAWVGHNAIETTERLLRTTMSRLGYGPFVRVPPSRWRHMASIFVALFTPVFGALFLYEDPLGRRFMLASGVRGQLLVLASRGAISEIEAERCVDAAFSWARFYGAR